MGVKILEEMKRFYRNQSIKKKLIFILYIQILIPLILIGLVNYSKSSQILRNNSISYSMDILQIVGFRLQDAVDNLKILSDDLIYEKIIYEVLDYESINYDPLKSYEKKFAVSNTLKNLYLVRDEIQSACLISNDGKYYTADSNTREFEIEEIVSPVYNQILSKAREGRGQPVWFLQSYEGEVEHLLLTRSIYSRDTYKEIGLMVILIKKEFMESIYQGLTTEITRNMAVISAENNIIISRSQSWKYTHKQEILKQLTGDHRAFVDDEQGVLVTYTTLDNPGWRVITYVELKDLYKDISVLQSWVIILSVVFIFLMSIFSIFVALDFAKPINRMVKAMEDVQKGDRAVNVSVDRGDELGYMARAFNRMSSEISHLVKWIYREQITRKEAELKALQSQINPHFLFNTLESINWMARLNNVPEISETVESLSSILEAGIGRDELLITIEEEINYIDNYISILKKRFEDRLEFVKDIDKISLSVEIPRLLIQPLIENAVYHGIERTRKKGYIRIESRIHGDHLTIEIMDNGAGISKDDLNTLNEKLSVDNDTYFRTLAGKKGKGIGIENVNRRIKLFYGEKYGITIKSQEGSYTRVVMTIPTCIKDIREGYYVQGSNNR